MANDNAKYTPTQWEKITAVAVAFFIVGLISFLVIRDRPFSDLNFAIFVRILLSLSCAILGAVVPGFLQVDLQKKGLAIRAGGALALFVLTFFFTPSVIFSSQEQTQPSEFIVGYVPYSAIVAEDNSKVSIGKAVVTRGVTVLRPVADLSTDGQVLKIGTRAVVIELEEGWVKLKLHYN